MKMRIPRATYRLQMNRGFGFAELASLVDYLSTLGISDCYLSPILAAIPGSMHGYDVVDPGRLNPEIGTDDQFRGLHESLERHRMGVLLDLVPNHMGIGGSANGWWNDVLENGMASPFAGYFDIDWSSPRPNLQDRVLLPVLGDQFGKVLENQEIQVGYADGRFHVSYYEKSFPLAPESWTLILNLLLERVSERLDEDHENRLELESIITGLRHLPSRVEIDEDGLRERIRERAILIKRLGDLTQRDPSILADLESTLQAINGFRGDPRSFDLLEELLESQPYRLSYWRVAFYEINYRRFFDINELAAIRVENPDVFDAVHALPLRLFRDGWIQGFRIDHPDGLYDPKGYFDQLQIRCREVRAADSDRASPAEPAAYVVAEKILAHGEELPPRWPVHGTTGYDFLNLVNGLYVDRDHAKSFLKGYHRFSGDQTSFAELTYGCKKLVLKVSMSSELHVLTNQLERIANQHRSSRDFTRDSLQEALVELIASFPVYRTYVREDDDEVSQRDRNHILTAIRTARRHNPAINRSLFEFIGSILLMEDPAETTETAGRERRRFLMRYQQITSPVMAKGLEDTAFYRYYPLASLNEVGGEPHRFGTTPGEFHEEIRRRQESIPHSLLASSTHDSKRSEDLRARLNVLSEIPKEWNRALRRWSVINRRRKVRVGDHLFPDPNEEYLLYQTMLGVWPLGFPSPAEHAQVVDRIEQYAAKAFKEAKTHTSWIDPNEEHDQAIRIFINRVLEPSPKNRFLSNFGEFKTRIVHAGLLNSLSQTLIKLAAPGVPDFYQGCELWDFSLVDPDNRRPVDFTLRRGLLAAIEQRCARDPAGLAREVMAHLPDGRAKMFMIYRVLGFRRSCPDLFERGVYRPLEVVGSRERHVIAFARSVDGRRMLAVATRFFFHLGGADRTPDSACWGDTRVILDDGVDGGRFRDVLTGCPVTATTHEGRTCLSLCSTLGIMPFALLESLDGPDARTST